MSRAPLRSRRLSGSSDRDAVEGRLDVLRHVPLEIASLLSHAQGADGRRQRVFLMLWFAGYEAFHAAVLAPGSTEEVEAL